MLGQLAARVGVGVRVIVRECLHWVRHLLGDREGPRGPRRKSLRTSQQFSRQLLTCRIWPRWVDTRACGGADYGCIEGSFSVG